MRTTRCRSCGAEIIFAPTANDKRIPLNAEPDMEGNVLIDDDGVAVVYGPLEKAMMDVDTLDRLMMPHHATCTDWPARTIVETPPAPADPAEGRRQGATLREEGMVRASENADEGWAVAAERIASSMARWPGGFIGDDVMEQLIAEGYATHDARALGPVVRRVVRRNGLVRTGYEPSRRPGRHSGPVARWGTGRLPVSGDV